MGQAFLRVIAGVVSMVVAGVAAAAVGAMFHVERPDASDALGVAGQAARNRVTFNAGERAKQEQLFDELKRDPDAYRRIRITYRVGPTPREIAIYSRGIDGGDDAFSIRANEYFIVAGLKYETFRQALKLKQPVSKDQIEACVGKVGGGVEPSRSLAGCLARKR